MQAEINSDNNTPYTPPRVLKIAANILSDIFSPLLIPTYGMIMAVMLTQLQMLSAGVRLTACLGIAFITAVLPTTFIFILIRLGRVADTSISNPRERTAPYIAGIICQLCAATYVYAIHAPLWLIVFFLGAALTATISLLINRRWKISAHSGGIGGLAGIIFWLAYRDMLSGEGMLWVSLTVLLAGLISSSRLILNRHNLGQVAAGAALGFGCEFAALAIICN